MKRSLTDANNLPQQDDDRDQRPIWGLTPSEFATFAITSLNKAGDLQWEFSSNTPGTKKSANTIYWGMKLLDGSRLSDPRHSRRLEWARKLMALIMHAPAKGVAPSQNSMQLFQQGYKWLLSWMAMRGLHYPCDLDVSAYLEDLSRLIAEHNDDDEITVSQVTLALYILPWLWSERRGLQKWGVTGLRSNFFREHGINYYAKALATKASGWIPPLPDEVAIPLFNRVVWWLGEPAKDVLRLLECVIDPQAGTEFDVTTPQSRSGTRKQISGKGTQARQRRADRFLAKFVFRTLPGESQPWHAALNDAYQHEHGILPKAQLRILFDALRTACALCIQGFSGMRISELLGIEAGLHALTALPRGVRIEDSATGLYEVFLIHTVLSKTETGLPREMDWVLGMRPKGSREEPLPVKALRLLNRLYAPWRATAKSSRLILSGGSGNCLPLKSTAQGAMSSDPMRLDMKQFIARWVDLTGLPDESRHKSKDQDLEALTK